MLEFEHKRKPFPVAPGTGTAGTIFLDSVGPPDCGAKTGSNILAHHNTLGMYGGGVLCPSPSTATGFYNPRGQGSEIGALELGFPRGMALVPPPPHHASWRTTDPAGTLGGTHLPVSGSGGGAAGTTGSAGADDITTLGPSVMQTSSSSSSASGGQDKKDFLSSASASSAGGGGGGTTSLSVGVGQHPSSAGSGGLAGLAGGPGSGSSIDKKEFLSLQQSTTPGSQSLTSQNGSQQDVKAQNIECVVCGDKSSGKHYGQFTCEGSKGEKSPRDLAKKVLQEFAQTFRDAMKLRAAALTAITTKIRSPLSSRRGIESQCVTKATPRASDIPASPLGGASTDNDIATAAPAQNYMTPPYRIHLHGRQQVQREEQNPTTAATTTTTTTFAAANHSSNARSDGISPTPAGATETVPSISTTGISVSSAVYESASRWECDVK
ncbi:hypothetical protein AND_009751 [Anopheles darlingi]|uniref:Nuclear receptor domain-containing protein n=1 Tax=Anopheles darlingi TaxID=43151 RepID=W5J4C3_ANODA|nr:hypothetical protein AND_009751 [Anopheles darlingi]